MIRYNGPSQIQVWKCKKGVAQSVIKNRDGKIGGAANGTGYVAV